MHGVKWAIRAIYVFLIQIATYQGRIARDLRRRTYQAAYHAAIYNFDNRPEVHQIHFDGYVDGFGRLFFDDALVFVIRSFALNLVVFPDFVQNFGLHFVTFLALSALSNLLPEFGMRFDGIRIPSAKFLLAFTAFCPYSLSDGALLLPFLLDFCLLLAEESLSLSIPWMYPRHH